MPSLSVVRAANAKFAPSYIPHALFVGGTSGIGQAMAEAFARYTKGNAHIIICGRNRVAADAVIEKFPKPTVQEGDEQPVHEFVHCDAVLMKNIDATTKELLSRLPKLNFLVMSPGFFAFRGRDETEEGIDRKLALHYYARWKFTHDLIPLLRNAKDAGQDAKVFSVMGAGKGCEIDLDDLGLKKNYSFRKSSLTAPVYNDLMVEEFATRYPDMAFTHAYPGAVRTPMNRATHRALRPFNPLFQGLIYPFTSSSDDCAEHMLWALFDGEKGAFRRGSNGDDIQKQGYYGSDEASKRLWEHTIEVVG